MKEMLRLKVLIMKHFLIQEIYCENQKLLDCALFSTRVLIKFIVKMSNHSHGIGYLTDNLI